MRTMLFAAAVAGLTTIAGLAPANAEQVIVTGPQGGSGTISYACREGVYRAGCVNTWDYTTGAGKTWSGSGAAGVGPYRAGSARIVNTPNGNTWYTRRVWH